MTTFTTEDRQAIEKERGTNASPPHIVDTGASVMNNEPSYFGLTDDHTWLSVSAEFYKTLKPTHRMKCYTHPVKTLTEMEIDELWDKYLTVRDEYGEELQILGVHEFVDAILRKAGEK